MVEKFFGKEVQIGIDESNNGFSHPSFNPHNTQSLVIAGYIIEDPKRANYGAAKYEGK
jgi:hypothetical protein